MGLPSLPPITVAGDQEITMMVFESPWMTKESLWILL
jgi:hypothetical protein